MTGIEDIYRLFLRYPRISTDSRNISPDSIFFAIRGDHFNGNLFAADALNKGARFAIVDDPSLNSGSPFILVPDAVNALQELARVHRRHVSAKIIAITGSNGKTTTKELIGKVLDSTYKTVITRGNLNNHIGVPITILAIEKDTSFAVVEMGANHPGEIADLCRIAQPDCGLITNIGKAHLEGFGSYEGVIKAKSELYQYVRNHEGLLFLNSDNQLLCNLAGGIKSLSYGSGENAVCRGKINGRDPYLSITWSSGNQNGFVMTNLFGDYNFENVMAAVCLGLHFGIVPEQIDNALSSYIPDNNRSQVMRTGHNVLILDAYNANPSSMNAALDNFREINAPSKMLILGDMMELGESGLEEHRQLIARIRELSFANVIFIGELFSKAAGIGKELCFTAADEAGQWLLAHPVQGMTILLKGSRKMKLESLSKFL